MSQNELDLRLQKLEEKQAALPENFQNDLLQMLSKMDQRLMVLENRGGIQTSSEACELNDYGVQLYYLNEIDQALEIFKDALNKDPDSPEICSNLGVVYTVKGESEKAMDYFKRAVEIDGNRVEFINNKGVLAIFQSDPTEAVALFERAHFRDPQHQSVLYNLGKAYVECKQLKKAMQMFRLILNINPEHKEAADQLRQYYQ